ncbi:MAG: DUF3575 domain-containing protein [Prevotella sp.]|nr:DUF3575 domain-containing protein [Prevotella sp.]
MSTIKLHRAVCALLLLLASATGKAQNLALKTNLLYDAVLIPNIGVEVSLGKQWTASADWFYTWFSSDNRHRYWQGYGGYLTVRRYFANHSTFHIPHSSFHIPNRSPPRCLCARSYLRRRVGRSRLSGRPFRLWCRFGVWLCPAYQQQSVARLLAGHRFPGR